jgi:hypothetical protein
MWSEFSVTPSAKRGSAGMKTLILLEDFDPFRHFSWRAEGGGQSEIVLDSHAFLAFRQLTALAEGALL